VFLLLADRRPVRETDGAAYTRMGAHLQTLHQGFSQFNYKVN
jgi:hypothetical protein